MKSRNGTLETFLSHTGIDQEKKYRYFADFLANHNSSETSHS